MEQRYPEPGGTNHGEREDEPDLASLLAKPVPGERRVAYYCARIDALNRVEARLSPTFDHEALAISCLEDVRERVDSRAALVIETVHRQVRRVSSDPGT